MALIFDGSFDNTIYGATIYPYVPTQGFGATAEYKAGDTVLFDSYILKMKSFTGTTFTGTMGCSLFYNPYGSADVYLGTVADIEVDLTDTPEEITFTLSSQIGQEINHANDRFYLRAYYQTGNHAQRLEWMGYNAAAIIKWYQVNGTLIQDLNPTLELSAAIAGTSAIAITSGLPGAPTSPSPTDAATGTNLSTGFSWTAGANTDTFTISLNVDGAGYEELSSLFEDASYSLTTDPLSYGVSAAWKVKATNMYGSTESDEWSFTCLSLDYPYPSWIAIDGGDGPVDGGTEGTDFLYTGKNNMITTKALVAVANNRLWYSSF